MPALPPSVFEMLAAAGKGAARGVAKRLPQGVFDALENSRLGMMSDAGPGGGLRGLPFMDAATAAPTLARRGAQTGIESDIDPRLVLGGAGLAAFPTAAGAATALDGFNHVIPPIQQANSARRAEDERESAVLDSQDQRLSAIRAIMRGYRPEDVERQDPELAAAMRALEGPPSGGLEKGAHARPYEGA